MGPHTLIGKALPIPPINVHIIIYLRFLEFIKPEKLTAEIALVSFLYLHMTTSAVGFGVWLEAIRGYL